VSTPTGAAIAAGKETFTLVSIAKKFAMITAITTASTKTTTTTAEVTVMKIAATVATEAITTTVMVTDTAEAKPHSSSAPVP
jgi:hypothetical protein